MLLHVVPVTAFQTRSEASALRQPPRIDFSEFVDAWKNLELLDPAYQLDCDPYLSGEDCDTVPPLQEGEVCAYELLGEDSAQLCPSSYRMYTTSRQTALDNGWMITHAEACGTCSTAQDLAVYMENPDLTAEGKRCAAIGVVSNRLGLQCYDELGMTPGCAAIWLYNSLYTGDVCRGICVSFTASGRDNNGAPPECELARCLQCDEEEAGPNFQLFGGRTRRRSGMLSAIVRTCSELRSDVTQEDPCEFWQELNPPPASSAPTGALSSAPTIDSLTDAPSNAPSDGSDSSASSIFRSTGNGSVVSVFSILCFLQAWIR